jgi:ankyrin repeat protein
MQDNIEDFITCPITKQIFNKPVLAEDGHIYEKSGIKRWFLNNDKSPMTNVMISKELIKVNKITDIIDEYLKLNPDKHKYEYEFELTEDTFSIENLRKQKKRFNINMFINKLQDHKFEIYKKEYLEDAKYFFSLCDGINNITDHDANYEFNLLNILIKTQCNVELIKHLIDTYNIDININKGNYYGETLIHLVCSARNMNEYCVDIINLLINKNANINAENSEGDTPIHLVCSAPNMNEYCVDIIKLLINKNANINAENYDGNFPIFYASRTIDMLNILLDVVDLNMVNRKNQNIIHYLCRYNLKDALKIILEKEKDIDINLIDIYNDAPIHIAYECQSYNCIDILLNHNVNLEVQGQLGYYPIQMACRTLNHKIIEKIINKANLKIQYKNNGSILNTLFPDIDYNDYLSYDKFTKTNNLFICWIVVIETYKIKYGKKQLICNLLSTKMDDANIFITFFKNIINNNLIMGFVCGISTLSMYQYFTK